MSSDGSQLKPYQFKPGQSGNPSGKPKGAVSMKTFAKNHLAKLPKKERIKFLNSLSSDIVWKMAEGNPDNKTDLTSDGKPLFNNEQRKNSEESIDEFLDGESKE